MSSNSSESEQRTDHVVQSNKSWLVTAALFFLGWVFMYADRTILSPVQAELRTEFALNNAQVGLISSIFFLVYTVVQIPSGVMGDRVGRTRLIFAGFMIFGVATGLTGLVGAFATLLLVRALAGFGEGFYYGPQYAVSSEAIPLRYRSFGYAIINSGQAFGITLGLMGSSYISYTLNWGWRATFMLFAVPTFVVGILILLFIKQGARPPASTQNRQEKNSVIALLKNPSLAAIFFIAFCCVYGFFVMVTWLPVYLEETRGIPHSKTGMVASLVAWTSVPSALLMGTLSDRLKVRKPILLCMMPLAIVSIVMLVTTKSWNIMIFSLVLYGLFGKLATDPLLLALISDNAPKANMSTVYGIYNCIAMVAAILAPYVTGWLKDLTHSFNSGFYLAALLIAVGWLTAAFLLHTKPVGEVVDHSDNV